MRVTVKDLAKHCGVSQPTVSRILNGGASAFKPDTVAKVEAAVADLGYRRNASAVATRGQRTQGLALLMDPKGYRSHTPRQLLNALQQHSAAVGQHLILDRIADEAVEEGRTPKVLTHHLVDGFLVNYDTALPEAMQSLIDTHRIPSVWLNVKKDRGAFYPDELGAGRMLVEDLLSRGCERIYYADVSYNGIPDSRRHYSRDDRLQGVKDAMASAGHNGSLQVYLQGKMSDVLADITAQTAQMVKCGVIFGEPSPHILFQFWSDVLGQGVKIGQDLVPASFGLDDYINNMPFVLAQPTWQPLAKAAVGALMDAIEGKPLGPSMAVACELKVTPSFEQLHQPS